MNDSKSNNLSREERLAAKLRENLRRRKAQGRDLASGVDESGESRVSKDDAGG